MFCDVDFHIARSKMNVDSNDSSEFITEDNITEEGQNLSSQYSSTQEPVKPMIKNWKPTRDKFGNILPFHSENESEAQESEIQESEVSESEVKEETKNLVEDIGLPPKTEVVEEKVVDEGEGVDMIIPTELDQMIEDNDNLGSDEDVVMYVLNRMTKNSEEDIKLVKENKPAYHKLLYCKKLVKQMKNHNVQVLFLLNEGLDYLCLWLRKSPDGNYPCLAVIETILEIVDFLPITTENLTKTKLGKIIKKLEKECDSEKLKLKCQEILNKWYRMIFDLNTGYDQTGIYEQQYREYREQKLREVKQIRGKDAELGKMKSGVQEYDHEQCGIVRDRAYVPSKNMFDFTYRPHSDVNPIIRSENREGTKSMIFKKMAQMQKEFGKTKQKYGFISRSNMLKK